MGHIHSVQIDNGSQYLIEPTLFTTATGNDETTTLTATIPNFELTPGVTITIKMASFNKASAQLSINGVSKPIYYKGAPAAAGLLKQGFIYNLVYDGVAWHVVGEKIEDGEIVLAHSLTFGAGEAYVYNGSRDITVPVFTGTIL